MNLFLLAELTTKSHPWQYSFTIKGSSKSVRSLTQPNLGVNWFEKSLEMPIVPLELRITTI
jgi:hypothetical protein